MIDNHFVRDKVQNGTIITKRLVGIITKTLGGNQHEKLLLKSGVAYIHTKFQLEGEC